MGDVPTYVLDGTQGTAAGRQGEERGLSREQVPVLMAADRSDDGQRCAAQGRCGGAPAALDPVVAKEMLVSDGRDPPCAAALGVSHEALTMGERVRGEDGEQPPQPVKSPPAIWTTT